MACRSLLAVMLLSALACGCRRETPIERAARVYRENQKSLIVLATLETMRVRNLTDAQLVRAYSHNGLGLGLRPQKTELHIGEPLRLRLVYKNIAARIPISATTCQGFSLTQQDETADQSSTVPLAFACSSGDPLRDNNVALQLGELKVAEITTADTTLRFNHAGSYRLIAQWQSLSPGSDILLTPSGYPPLDSNPLLITVR